MTITNKIRIRKIKTYLKGYTPCSSCGYEAINREIPFLKLFHKGAICEDCLDCLKSRYD